MPLVAPYEDVETVSSMIGLRPLGKIISPAVVEDLPLEMVPSSMIDDFFGAMDYWRDFFFKKGLVNVKYEHLDSSS